MTRTLQVISLQTCIFFSMRFLYPAFLLIVIVFSYPALAFSDCGEVMPKIKEKYTLFQSLHAECEARAFSVRDETVHFVLLQYGRSNDCSSGCFYSHACFIVDTEDVYPYSFSFYGDVVYEDNKAIENKEAFITLPLDKPIPYRTFCDDSRDCKSQLSGLSHPLLTSPSFQRFREVEIEKGGHWPLYSRFRWCMY